MVGKTVSTTTTLFTRLLVSIAAIAILTAFAAVFLLLLTGGMLWLGYAQLIQHGVDAEIAVLILSGIILALLAAIILAVQYHFRRLRRLARHMGNMRSSVSGKVSHIVDSFMEGLISN